MSYFILGFLTGLSLILVIGAQNIFVIEQGLKKEFVSLVCLICALSDLLLIFLGIFLFHYFKFFFTYFNPHVYSDTVFFLGNFSKGFILNQKLLFAAGASISSFLFFFTWLYVKVFI